MADDEKVAKAASMPRKSPDRELELKFLPNEASFKAIQRSPLLGPVAAKTTGQRLQSTYFDTEAGDLQLHRMVLRVRQSRGGHLLTLKREGLNGTDPFERSEIEVASGSSAPELALLGDEAEAEILRVTGGRPLLPTFSTDIRRTTRRVVSGAGEIEVAFDSGFIASGARRLPVREIELELKAGDPASLYRFGMSLLDAFPMSLGAMTKSQRGVLLSSNTPASAVRARSPDLNGLTVDQAIGAVISACLAQFLANWPAFDGPDRGEAVHQMRVAMRRLRAALAFFHRAFPCAEFVALRAEAKRIASVMGDARNWDVFADLVREGPRQAFPNEPGFDTLLENTERRLAAGHDAVAALLADAGTTRFVLLLQTFVSQRTWRNALPGADLPRLTEPAAGFAAECLERLHRRVRRRGRKLVKLAPEERHSVRIALKNLRYAADFFGELFDHSNQVRTYTQAAAKLQDALGAYNDMIMIAELLQELHIDDIRAVRAAGVVAGWYGRGVAENDAMLHDYWRRFGKAKRFWSLVPPPSG